MAKTIKQIADELNENLDALEHLKLKVIIYAVRLKKA